MIELDNYCGASAIKPIFDNFLAKNFSPRYINLRDQK